MWVCTKCGEPHQDQFKECWKCVGAEMETSEHVTAEPPRPKLPPPPERKLRSFGSILARAAVGFLFGLLLSMSSFNFIDPQAILSSPALSPAAKSVFGLAVGAIFAVLTGTFFWVVFPYEALPVQPDQERAAEGTNSLD